MRAAGSSTLSTFWVVGNRFTKYVLSSRIKLAFWNGWFVSTQMSLQGFPEGLVASHGASLSVSVNAILKNRSGREPGPVGGVNRLFNVSLDCSTVEVKNGSRIGKLL